VAGIPPFWRDLLVKDRTQLFYHKKRRAYPFSGFIQASRYLTLQTQTERKCSASGTGLSNETGMQSQLKSHVVTTNEKER
jgi:hypothetical protein